MKIFRYLTALAAAAMTFTACEKDPADLYALNATAPVMDSHADILLTENSTQESVTFSWKEARNMGGEVMYTLYATNNGQELSLTTTSGTYFTTGKDAFREQLLTGFGLEANNNFAIGMFVEAVSGAGSLCSESITMNVFVYGDYVPAIVSVAETAQEGIVLNESMTENVELINWTAARFEYGTNPLYKVEVVYGDGARQTLAEGLATTSFAMNPTTLNSTLIALGCVKDAANDVQFIVTSYLEGEGAPQLESTAVTVTVTPFTPSYPEFIKLCGDFGGHSWNTESNLPILKGDANTGVYHGLMSYYGGTYGMKIIYTHPKTQETIWVGAKTEDGVNFSVGVEDNIAPEEGSYVVYVDLAKGVMTLGKIESIGLIGSATANGWDGQTNFTYNAETGAMELKGVELGTGAYKVRVNDNWGNPWEDPTAYNLGGDPADMTFGGSDIPSEPGVYDVTMNLSTDANYALSFTKTGDVDVEDPSDKLYSLIGAFNNWEGDVDFVAHQNGFLKAAAVTLAGEFKVRVNHDWAESYGLEAAGEVAVGRYTLVSNGQNMTIAEGSYDFYFNPTTSELIIAAAGADDPTARVYSIIGAFNNWSGDVDMVAHENGFLKAAAVALTGSEFKVRADHDWTDSWGFSAVGDVTLGEAYTLVYNGQNMKLADGSYDFYFNPETLVFYAVEAGADDPTADIKKESIYGLVGDLNGWAAPDVKFIDNGNGEHVLLGQSLEAGKGFKIRANDEWNDAENYGTQVSGAVAINVATTLVNGGSSQNMSVETTATYDLYFYPADLKLFVMESGKTPADAGEGGDTPVVSDSEQIEVGLIGVGGDWNTDIKMTQQADGSYLVENVSLTATDTFKVRKAGAWDDNFNWGLTAAGIVEVGVLTDLTCSGGSGNMSVAADGEYNITFYPTLDGTAVVKGQPAQIKIDVAGATPPAPTNVYSLAGDMNNWAAGDTTYTLTSTEAGVYTVANVALNANQGFKICKDYAWDTSYGLSSGVTFAFSQKLGVTSDNGANIIVPGKGTFNITFYETDAQVLVEPVGEVEYPSEEHTYSLAGTFNSWTETDTTYTLIEGEEGVYTYQNLALTAAGEFKIVRDYAWTVSYGLSSGASAVVGQKMAVTTNNGANIAIAAGTYNITFYAASSELLIEAAGSSEPATPLEWGNDIFKNFYETESGSDKNTEITKDLDFGNGLKFIAGSGKCKFGADGGKYRIQYGGAGDFDKQTLALTVTGPGTLELTIRSSNSSEERYMGVWVDQVANYTDPGYKAPVSGEDQAVYTIDCSSAKNGSVINFHCLGKGINVYNIKWTPAQ